MHAKISAKLERKCRVKWFIISTVKHIQNITVYRKICIQYVAYSSTQEGLMIRQSVFIKRMTAFFIEYTYTSTVKTSQFAKTALNTSLNYYHEWVRLYLESII